MYKLTENKDGTISLLNWGKEVYRTGESKYSIVPEDYDEYLKQQLGNCEKCEAKMRPYYKDGQIIGQMCSNCYFK